MSCAHIRNEEGYLIAKTTISFFENMVLESKVDKHPTKNGIYVVNGDFNFQVPGTGIKFFIWKGYTVEVIFGE